MSIIFYMLTLCILLNTAKKLQIFLNLEKFYINNNGNIDNYLVWYSHYFEKKCIFRNHRNHHVYKEAIIKIMFLVLFPFLEKFLAVSVVY